MAKNKIIILGAGPAGLSAAYTLVNNNENPLVIEKDSVVGGLSKTINYKGFRFDLGGHRFWTKNEEVDKFVKDIIGDELIVVPRTSRILLKNKFFDYPLKPLNAFFGMGLLKSFQILGDYAFIKIKNLFRPKPEISFEDWIVNRFGRIMYLLYFKPYTEKVWNTPCTEISSDWAAQRIKGMSLKAAIKDAFFKSKNAPKTLVKEFTFPKLGIGRISDRLAEKINNIHLESNIVKLEHKNDKIISIEYINKNMGRKTLEPENIISTIPLTELIHSLDPQPPKEIIEHANNLKFVDEIFVFLVINKDSVTTDSWIYFPDDNISFVRIHEPKNWSKDMAKPGKTGIVAEYICKENDKTWKEKDDILVKRVINDLEKLNFIKKEEIIDSCVIRTKKTYPLYDIGYINHLKPIKEYLKRFKNLQIIGRGGSFKYNNVDHSIEMGIKAAKNILGESHDLDKVGQEQEYFEQKL